MNNFMECSEENGIHFIHYVRNELMHLNNKHVKQLFLHLAVAINKNNDFFKLYSACRFNNYLPYIVKDICLAKLRKSFTPKKNLKHFMVFTFCNKYFNSFNVSKVLKNKTIMDLFPVNNDEWKLPGIAFKYSNTIRNKIVNYKQVIQEGITPLHCNCDIADPLFVDRNSGHIFTGNLDFITNVELKGLLQKGLNYRENVKPDKEKLKESLQNGLERYITEASSINKIPVKCFLPWKMEILKMLDTQISKLVPYKYNNVLSKQKTGMIY